MSLGTFQGAAMSADLVAGVLLAPTSASSDCVRVSISVRNIYVHCGRCICSGAISNNVKCMYTSVSGHIVDSFEFI